MKNKDKVLNVLFILLEVAAIITTIISVGKIQIEYYTEDSNIFALIVTIIYSYYLFSNKKVPKIVNILRLSSLVMLMITFLTVSLVLVPIYRMDLSFAYWGPNFFYHLVCPILFFINYTFLSKKEEFSTKDLFISTTPTIIYGIIVTTMNVIVKGYGPYPFLYVYEQPVYLSVLWILIFFMTNLVITICLSKLSKK
jgi:hypothetical protein